MLDRPFQHQRERPPGQRASRHAQLSNVNHRLVFAVQGVECGGPCSRQNIWITIPKKVLIVGTRSHCLEAGHTVRGPLRLPGTHHR